MQSWQEMSSFILHQVAQGETKLNLAYLNVAIRKLHGKVACNSTITLCYVVHLKLSIAMIEKRKNCFFTQLYIVEKSNNGDTDAIQSSNDGEVMRLDQTNARLLCTML